VRNINLVAPRAIQRQPASILNDLAELIGNTPLVAIDCVYRGRPRTIYAKCEHLNWTGSIKDRMALEILRRGYSLGKIGPTTLIAEATSGNAGISLSALARTLGNPVKIFVPDWMSRERMALISSFGAEVVLVSREQGGFPGSIKMSQQLVTQDSDVFLTCQFSNYANVEAHETGTGPEIWSQLEHCGLVPDAFVAGVGTGGTVMGVGRSLKARNPKVRIHPVEPAESPTLSTGHKVGHHRIQGISDEFIPSILHLSTLDQVLRVHDGDAILMARKLAAKLGLGVGISSGCNFLAALQAAELVEPDAVVVTVLVDDNKKYLSTDLFRDEPSFSHFQSPDVELTGLRVIHRGCRSIG